MEERTLEDEIGRKIKFKRNPDGTVEMVDDFMHPIEGEEELEEYEYIELEESDDEELASLSPEEARRRIEEREAEENARRQEYERLCQEGEKLLETGSFKAAELKYEKALPLDDKATVATVGYWRAKTADFSEPEVLIEEYAKEGADSLENDLGYEAVDQIKKTFRDKFQPRYDEISKEEEELSAKVEEGQQRRRGLLKARLKKASITFALSCVVTVAMLVLALVFWGNNFTVSDGSFIAPTIIFVCLFILSFVFFGVCTNKFVNAVRIHNANERLSSTEDGERVLALRSYKEIYEYLLA